MADAISIGGLVSTGLGFMGDRADAKAAKKAGKYNEQISMINQAMSGAMGKQAYDRSKLMSRAAVGSQQAAQAASGGSFSGSALDTMRQSIKEGEYDALAAKQGYDIQGLDFGSEATQSRMRRRNLSGQAGRGAVTGLLTQGVKWDSLT